MRDGTGTGCMDRIKPEVGALCILNRDEGREPLMPAGGLLLVDDHELLAQSLSWALRAECLEAGASGLLDKSTSFGELVDGIREAMELGILITPHRREQLLGELRHQRTERTKLLEPFQRLTTREREVRTRSRPRPSCR